MAVPKALTTHIQDLINGIGDLDRPAIKAKLVRFLRLAEALESGAATRKTEAKIARLKTLLEKADAAREQANAALKQSSAEIGNLQSELQTMQAEIAKYQAERTKEEKREREMPDIQFDILQRLPTEHIGDGATLQGISRRARLPPDEVAVHLNRLVKAGFAQHRSHYMEATGTIMAWHRTVAGDELVLAKRLAGEEEAGEQEDQEAPELTQTEQLVLLAVAAGDRVPKEIVKYIAKAVPTVGSSITNAGTVLLLLVTLREKKMVNEERISGTPSRWELSRSGRAYVADLSNFS